MGVNYVRRARMEPLGGVELVRLYGLGTQKQEYEILDEQIIYDRINRELDGVEERFRIRLSRI